MEMLIMNCEQAPVATVDVRSQEQAMDEKVFVLGAFD